MSSFLESFLLSICYIIGFLLNAGITGIFSYYVFIPPVEESPLAFLD